MQRERERERQAQMKDVFGEPLENCLFGGVHAFVLHPQRLVVQLRGRVNRLVGPNCFIELLQPPIVTRKLAASAGREIIIFISLVSVAAAPPCRRHRWLESNVDACK